MKRAFASLDPQEALHVAIFIEERNAGIYQRLAEMFIEFGDPESLEISNVFWDMAVEERSHGTLLQARYTDLYGDSRCALTEEDLLEFIEVPDIHAYDLFPATPPDEGESRGRALQIALDAELSAQHFYRSLAENTPDGHLRRLYVELATMEDGHVAQLQRKLVPSALASREIH